MVSHYQILDLNQMAITLSVLYSLVFVVYTLYYRQILWYSASSL